VKKEELNLQQVTVFSSQNTIVDHITDNKNGYREMIQLVQAELDAKDTQVKYHYLVELYDNELVYEVRMQGEGTTYYKQNYTTSNNDEVEFVGDPVEVQREVNFIALEVNPLKRTKFSSNNKNLKKEVKVSDLKKAPCPDRVNELIALESTKYTDKDKEWLLTLEAENIEKMFPNEPEKEETPQVNAEDVKKAVIEALTWEEIEKKMPKEKQDQLSVGLKLYKTQLADMIKGILESTDEGTWTEDDLKVMEMDTLEKVYKSVQRDVTDFSPLGGNAERPNVNDNEEEPLFPTGIELEKEEASKN